MEDYKDARTSLPSDFDRAIIRAPHKVKKEDKEDAKHHNPLWPPSSSRRRGGQGIDACDSLVLLLVLSTGASVRTVERSLVLGHTRCNYC